MADRRRVNGPAGGTSAPLFASFITKDATTALQRPERLRKPNEPRKMCKLCNLELRVQLT